MQRPFLPLASFLLDARAMRDEDKRGASARFTRDALLTVVVAGLLGGCGSNIGDPCASNIDCSPLGDRFCDTAPPGGYCTQQDCDVNSCPGNSVCIRFFTALATEPCHPLELLLPSDCPHDREVCVCDLTIDGVCQGSGHCAPLSSEERWCQARCGHDGDCRGGYECRETGTSGAEPVPTFDMTTGMPAKFCAPTGLQ